MSGDDGVEDKWVMGMGMVMSRDDGSNVWGWGGRLVKCCRVMSGVDVGGDKALNANEGDECQWW